MGTKIIIGFLAILFVGCGKDNQGVCLSGRGADGSETRSIEAFTSLEVKGNFEVVFHPKSPDQKVVFSGGKNLLPGCKATVQNGKLIIDDLNTCNWLRSFKEKIQVDIYGNYFSTLEYRAAGHFSLSDTMVVPEFTLLTWESSGDLDLLLRAKECFIKLNTGNSDVTIRGETDYLYCYNLSQGFIYAKDFPCKDSYVVQNGYGDVYINPNQNLRVEIAKIGDVYYPGQIPVDATITGTGKLKTF